MTDSRGIVSSYSPAAQDLLGYLPEEILGEPLQRFIKGGERVLGELRNRLREQTVVRKFEVDLIGKDQREVPVDLSASLVSDGSGRSKGLIVLCHDLGEIRRLETQIHQKEQFFASIIRNSADAIITLDSQERVTSWNRGAETMLGYTEQEMIGQSLDIIVPVELRRQKELERISRVARTEGYLRSYRTQRITKDGQLIDVIFTRSAIKDNQGKITGFSSVMKDVTQQELSDRLFAQMEKLSAIGELAAGLAHEIKNPLAGIKGAIEIIRDRMDEDYPHRMVLDDVLSEVTRIDRIVMNLLSYSKPRKPNFVKTNLMTLMGNVIALIQNLAASKRILLQVQSEENTPSIMGDENDLRQLFMNLLLNSIEALEIKGRVWIKFRTSSDSKFLKVEVLDNGPGIPEGDLPKIFQPFYTTKKQGTGLGLATCKRIVLDHGGEIRVESELGKGTRFLIDFPLNPTVLRYLSSEIVS